MKSKPLTREHAERLAAHFKPLENKYTFRLPSIAEILIVSTVTIAPSKGTAQDEFKFNLQTGFELKTLVDNYKGTDFTVLVIANILSVDNITLNQPYFFDIHELSDKKINGFDLPAQLI